MIIGGGTVYEATTSRWDRLYLTVVEGKFQGDTYFPLDRVTGMHWRSIAREVLQRGCQERSSLLVPGT